MTETKKDPVDTLTDEDIVSTALTRRSLLAQTGLVLGPAGMVAIGVSTTAKAETVDEDDSDTEPGAPDTDSDDTDE